MAYAIALLAASGAVPFVVGLLASRWAPKSVGVGAGPAAGFALGAAALLFLDYIKEGADLGQATGRPGLILLLAGSFAAGLVLAAGLPGPARVAAGAAWSWAAATALHGMGEGLLVTSDIAGGTFVLSWTQGLSFAIHKGLEGSILGVLAASGRRVVMILAAVSLAPLLLAPLVTSVAPPLAPTVAFAGAAGAALLALAPLGGRALAASSGMGRAGWILAGALAVFGAGLLHQF